MTKYNTGKRWGFEVWIRDGIGGGKWSAEHCGVQDGSNTFGSAEEAEQELPTLADVLGVALAEVRVARIG